MAYAGTTLNYSEALAIMPDETGRWNPITNLRSSIKTRMTELTQTKNGGPEKNP